MKPSFFSIRWKLLSGFVGLILITVIVLLLSVGQLVETRIKNDIQSNFEQAGTTFERIQDIRLRQLRQTAILLADVPSLKAAISTGDTSTVSHKIKNEIRYLLDFDPIIPDSLIPENYYLDPDSSGLILVSDKVGLPLGQLSTRPLPSFSIADRAGVTDALNGEMLNQPYIWKENDRYFNVISVPIWAGYTIVGTLNYGLPIRQIETQQLSSDLNMEVIFYVDDQLLATTLDGLNSDDLSVLNKKMHDATYEVLKSRRAQTSEITLNNETWLVYLAPMFKMQDEIDGIKGYYGVAKSLNQALIPLQNLQLVIFIIGLLAIIASILISIFLTGKITRPIHLLVEGVKRVEKEDFSEKVPVTTNDEIGTLTSAFNGLVDGLRQRLLMLKFVSEATLDAIQKNLSRIEPGGERREITVFFSDIRGFTAWSEKHTPEQVIDMLNNLLSFQAELVHEFGGDVDKFVGDELVAVFQGPDKDQKAVEAAIRIQQQLPSMLNKEEMELAVGIGINSGEAVMGAMGSENRMDYTVLGNTVNLGARLCSAAKKHQILISNNVFLNLERKIPTKELERIQAKGIKHPVQIFEIDWQHQTKELLELKEG
ncbi:MAG: adenylate/guanylate cyclase domain-containing protein [Balneolaceae bacterium]